MATLHLPPAAVTVTCKPQQAAKNFFSCLKHVFANSMCFFTSLLWSFIRRVLPVKTTPSYFLRDEKIFEIELSSTGSTMSISQFDSSFFICCLKFSDCGTQPALLKLEFSSFVLPSTINNFKMLID